MRSRDTDQEQKETNIMSERSRQEAIHFMEEEKQFLIENGVIRPEDDYDLHEWAAPEFLAEAMKEE